MNNDLQEQFVRDMLTESHEGLDRYDRAILLLEKGTADRDTLNDVFRVVHTLKGTAGCLGFHAIEKLAHAGENLLDPLRSGLFPATPAIAAALLRLSDGLRAFLQAIETTGSDKGDHDNRALIAELQALRDSNGQSGGASAPASPTKAPPAPAAFGLFDDDAPAPAPAPATPTIAPVANVGWGLFDGETPAPSEVAPTPDVQNAESAPPAPVAANANTPATTSAPVAGANATVRVDVSLLDKLMNLVGELVLSRNQLTQVSQARRVDPAALNQLSQRLSLVTSELQEGVMKTRMQPIGNVWAKFPRIVRDIAHDLGKQVRLETVGAETELDRTIIEAIRDPLTHIIRNSIDHGIESPQKRAAAGKIAEGHILMRAYHEGGQVIIEIIDDGAGINVARVKQKAIEKNLISHDEAARLGERESIALIFLPGFSTAEQITNVSGRGVGMDVVKTNIEKIGGAVDVTSTQGQGTTLRIKIPLTLAIVPALIVRTAGDRFAIPQVSLLELVRLDGEEAGQAMESVCGAPVFRLRGRLVPLVFLDQELQIAKADAPKRSLLNIVVLQADQRQFGLVVDEVCDTEEIVVKPLGKQLKGLPVYAGATIMGDGRLALILDALGLAQRAGVIGENRAQPTTVDADGGAASNAHSSRQQLLLFSAGGSDRLAIHLDQAARLEEFEVNRIELSGRRETIQYRGRIMPLVRLSQFIPGGALGAAESKGPLQVIVYDQAGQNIGLVVGEIADIIEDAVEIQPGSGAAGLLGSAIVQGKVTDLVDVPGVLRAAGFSLNKAA